jgi:hypothetical protein
MERLTMPKNQIEAKNHDYREPKTLNRLIVDVICPYHEAIIDENRLEEALRAATGVPDLEVQNVRFEVYGPK